ncbi:MAG: response regulator transcription factor [Oscillospiraceae bacterium]
MYKILVVEDDFIISENIKKHLSKWDYIVETVTDFKEVLSEFNAFSPQLVLLDITLPFMNGYYWCAEIRKECNVPIIFISSASDNINIVMAMNMGGDDFIAKPFDLNVLTAKVSALIRRTYSFGGDVNVISNNDVLLNLSDVTLSYKSSKLDLTKNELKILQLLFENSGKVVSRDAIMLKLWDSDSFIDDNTLTVNITRLRKKLEEIELFDYIKTKKGIGYMVE